MKDYQEIRQRHLRGESQRSIAKELHLSRKTVAKYCDGAAVPWERKTPERAPVVMNEEAVAFIRRCLKSGESEGARKQQHTAKRICDRLAAECGFTEGEFTVRAKVRELKGTLPEAFIPLSFSPGEAM